MDTYFRDTGAGPLQLHVHSPGAVAHKDRCDFGLQYEDVGSIGLVDEVVVVVIFFFCRLKYS